MTTVEMTEHQIKMLYKGLDNLALEFAPERTVLLFDVNDGSDVKTYAALFAGDRWWVTGGTSPNGADTEDLLAWMIRKNVDPEAVLSL